jgi:membrane-bound inhibitor of C-type lysozyme
MVGKISQCSMAQTIRLALGTILLAAVVTAAQAATSKVARGPFVFLCQGSPATKLDVTFLGKNAERARLAYKGETVVAKHALSADGARYQAPGIDFWNKGDDATVEWRGKSLNCSIKK